MAKKKADTGLIELRRLEDSVIAIPISGQTPVIPHRWSEKAKRMMPGHPEKDTVKAVKGPKDPVAEATACQYFIDKKKWRIGMPATAFKAALIGACRLFERPTMVEAKQLLYVVGEGPEQLVEITGERVLREDTPRLPNGNADLRYRYAYRNWKATVTIAYPTQLLSQESVLALLDAGGRGGIGDWRPSAPKSLTGTFGTWRVDMDADPKEGKKVKRG